jgi:hypothetical protein
MELRGDERAQSVVIGSLLVFTIIVLSFSAYQAFSVPSQNAEIEAEHFQDVEDQFSELRTSVVNAVGSDVSHSTAIDLGTRYPSRAIALNPPPAAGRLRTTDPGDVEFDTDEDVCRTGAGTPTSRSLVYRPGYNEFQQPESIGYESRLVSRQFRDGSLFDQRLVRSGSPSEIDLYLLTGAVDENGVNTYSLELNATDEYTTTLTDPTITMPSRFEAATWNDEILSDRSAVTATNDGDRVKLDFSGGEYRVSCAVVGLEADPGFTPPADGGTGSGSGGGGGGGDYGQGSESTYSSDNDTETVSVPNGKWNGITATDELILSGGEQIYDTSNGQDVIEYTATFRNNQTGDYYTVSYVARQETNGSLGTHTVRFDPQDENASPHTPDSDTFLKVTENGTAYEGADLLDPTNYQSGSGVHNDIQEVKALADADTGIITSGVQGRVDITVREEALFSAVQPQPSDDPDLAFVRVSFETPTDTTGWEFRDDENEVTSLPDETVSGDVYFAVDETAFEDERGFDDGKVYPLDTSLDSGDALTLADSQGRVRDEAGYNGETTNKGAWSIDSIGSSDVAVRKQFDTDLQDSDTSDDWRSESQTSFFATTTTSVAYVPESSGDEIRTIDTTGTVRTYGSDSPAPSILGPKSDVDGDGVDEVPYVDGNGALKFMESDGTLATLAGNADTSRALGVGNRDGDDTTNVYYVGGGGTELYVVQDGGTPEEIQAVDPSTDRNNQQSITAVAVYGDGDIDGDGDVETVFQRNETHLGYVDYGTDPDEKNETVLVELDGTVPSSPATGGGEPLTFDGKVQVPVVDGDNGIVLVDESGTTTQVLDGSNRDTAKGAPIAPVDWTDDGSSELVFINGNDNQNLYYVSPAAGPTETGTEITDSSGNNAAAAEKGAR